jgi:hypothetical protein
MAQSSISSKAQEAMKKEYEHRKKLKNEKSKVQREAEKQHKRNLKIQKAKNKRKGK